MASDGKVDLSLRKSKLRFSKFFSLADCEEGVILRGKVKKIESFGLFINIISSDVTALCHISEVWQLWLIALFFLNTEDESLCYLDFDCSAYRFTLHVHLSCPRVQASCNDSL